MTGQEIQLLLKDLCARLPYGIVIHYDDGIDIFDTPIYDIGYYLNSGKYYIGNIKPYLRPMSSMTKEEKEQYDHRLECVFYDSSCNESYVVDWLNAKHLDYRGLIGKSLALEAPEGMYDIK